MVYGCTETPGSSSTTRQDAMTLTSGPAAVVPLGEPAAASSTLSVSPLNSNSGKSRASNHAIEDKPRPRDSLAEVTSFGSARPTRVTQNPGP